MEQGPSHDSRFHHHPAQVAVSKGDEVEVEGEEIEGWLQVLRLTDGARGLVPAWSVTFTS